ncbi:hypothetical protein [Carnobacterium sp. TMP28]|uniref:hypothetical protein n=1 Tax=Carnobacterium sp. TMP28 TaxID=3397060 RepID=UPI0039DFFB6E
MSLYSYIGVEKKLAIRPPQDPNIVALIARDTLDAGVTDEMVLSYLRTQTDNEALTMNQIVFYDKEAEIVGTFEILELVESGDILKHFGTPYVYQTTDFPVWEPIENDTVVPDGFTTKDVADYYKMMDEARSVNDTQQKGFLSFLTTYFKESNKIELYSCWDGDELKKENYRRELNLEVAMKNNLLFDMREKEFIVVTR